MSDPGAALDLTVSGLSKSFGGLSVLQDITFTIPAGTTLGLIGPNGAGKTTVTNIICGSLRSDKGEVRLGERRLNGLPPFRRCQLGIGRTFQTMRVFGEMTSIENVMVGAHGIGRVNTARALFRYRMTKREEQTLREKATEYLRLVGTDPAQDEAMVSSLTVSQQRAVELARALVAGPKVLILDEPASGLDPDRVDSWIDLLKQLKDTLGMTVLLIEHRMDVITRMSDSVVAIHGGRVITQGTPDQVLGHEDVRRIYLGAL
jgi:ABC-type branched-subunit amino acid transport system ATPase component